MMKRWWHYLIAGVVAWVCFMLWRFPAAAAYGMVAESLGSKVQLVGLAGTLWHGTAQQLQYQDRALGRLDWRLSPWGLLLGRLGGEVQLNQGDAFLLAEGRTPLGGGELTLSQLEGRIPLALLQPYLRMVPLPLDGSVSLKLEDIVINAEGRLQQANGRIVWHQAGVLAPQKLQFGDLQMSLQGVADGGVEGSVSDSGGPLQLRATLQLGSDGRYQLTGQVQAAASAPQELQGALSMLGKADSQGAHPLNFSGSL